eukprot:TRINITY_DN9278_c0_g1_i1.p1 TRINITY_DN9278_c0_g1~~TRINITY_DN9278_c0_g1_i1.p1  ORF type:complete len:115 (+),score=13.42 TRINITY_DN9278_c0_g1_i1:84-428(+)
MSSERAQDIFSSFLERQQTLDAIHERRDLVRTAVEGGEKSSLDGLREGYYKEKRKTESLEALVASSISIHDLVQVLVSMEHPPTLIDAIIDALPRRDEPLAEAAACLMQETVCL